MTCLSVPVSAEISFAGDAITGKAPVNKVGSLLLGEGLAIMTANTMEIQGKGPNGQQQSQLSGQIFKTSQVANTVKGHVYFDRGPGLGSLDSASCDDYVKMTDGSKVAGPITELSASAITCGRKSIPMNEVSEVHSARVFRFSAAVGDKPHMNFESTCVKANVVKVKQQSNSDFPLKKVVIVTAIVAVVACAIALPIAIPLGLRHHHHHHNNTTQINRYVYGRSRSSSSSSSSNSQFSSSGP